MDGALREAAGLPDVTPEHLAQWDDIKAWLRQLADLMAPLERRDPPFHKRPGMPHKDVHFVEPRLVGNFVFAEWTDGGQLRAPAFKGLRDDKDARDVVREVPS